MPPTRPADDAAAGEAEWLPRRGALEICVPQFEGPLDVLLHLVRSQDLDILDLPIALIARQFNEHLDCMQALNLEVAAEHLLMAATLAHIKSRMLLPVEPGPDGLPGDDPRAELAHQLIEYERFKRAAEGLAALESGRDLVFARLGPPPSDLTGEWTIRADLSDIVRAFERIVHRLEAEERVDVIRREDFRVQDMMQRILDRLERGGAASFRLLLQGCRTRLERIVLFLALLELMRLGSVSAWQATWRGDIQLERRAVAAEAP